MAYSESRVRPGDHAVLLFLQPDERARVLACGNVVRVRCFGSFQLGGHASLTRPDGGDVRATVANIALQTLWGAPGAVLVTVTLSDGHARGAHFECRALATGWLELRRRELKGMPDDGACPVCLCAAHALAEMTCGNKHACCLQCAAEMARAARSDGQLALRCPMCRERIRRPVVPPRYMTGW